MSTYIDSSVLLRIILGEPEPLATWSQLVDPISSELIRLECLRTIDRSRIRLRLRDDDVARWRADVLEAVNALTLVAVDRSVLDRAAEPFPTLLGSLDAIHLASAVLVREQRADLTFATHDRALADAAVAVGFQVDGMPPHPRGVRRAAVRDAAAHEYPSGEIQVTPF